MTYTWAESPKESGLQFYDLSHPWGHGVPCWPYFEDVKIERLHGMAKSRVLTQKITTVMHSGTHIDAPGHVVAGHAAHPRDPAAQLLRHRSRPGHPQGQVGGHHRRGPRGREPGHRGPRGRHRHRQHRLAPHVRRLVRVLRLLTRLLQGGRRVVRRSARSRRSAPTPRPSTTRSAPPSARTGRPRRPAACCPGPAASTRS